MPRPDQIAVVTANGQRYDIWTQIEVSRSAADVIDHALLTVSEISPRQSGMISSLKLAPGDNATVTLAGQLVLNGRVYLRQAAVDATNHQVQIGIASAGQVIMSSTVDSAPGQYVNQTLQQIASACFGKVGVTFKIDGTPSGAEMAFPRVSEQVGESRFAFIERLCRMRNVYMLDDGQGGILAFRGAAQGNAVLKEGLNILRGRVVLHIDEHAREMQVVGHDANNDSADTNRSPTGTTSVDPPIGGPFKIIAEEMGNSAAMQLRANHQADWDRLQQVDGDVTVTGWFAADGQLWFSKVRQKVTVNSPSLLPQDTLRFMIKGVVHRQSNEGGTTTDIQLCREDGLGINGSLPLQQ